MMRMSGILRACVCLVAVCASFATNAVQAKMSVGTNLNAVNYYSTEAPFADLMKMAKPWVTSTVANGEWDSGQEASIPLDGNGWPKYIPFNDPQGRPNYVHTQIPAYANGTYTIKVSGVGQIRISGPGLGGTVFNVNWSTITVNINGANLGAGEPNYLYLDILNSNASNPIGGIQVWRPGYGDGTRTFYQGFKDKLAPYSTLRFMDWGKTNDSGVTDYWSGATMPTYYTQDGPSGVSLDYMCQLCNETGKDMWFCVPAKASDSYCNGAAWVITQKLNSNRKVYVEYTNEAWNGQFSQGGWINANLPDPTGQNLQPRKYGYRASQVFGVFAGQFANAGRSGQLVRVLAGQAASSWVLQQALIGANNQCDAIAIAPYFGGAVSASQISNGIPSFDTLLTDESFCHLQDDANWLAAHAQLAQQIGKPLLCYEGGQHYVGTYSGGNTFDNQALTDQLNALNRSWQMKSEYRWGYNGKPGYLSLVNGYGVSLFMHFADCGIYSKSGSWGSAEYIDQPVGQNGGQALKAWALQDWIANG